MQDMDDIELLRRYARNGSEEAFDAVVSRHLNLVYSVALRHLGNPHQAEEITQAVFVILARKAHSLRKGVLLPGWLHKTAWFTADNFRKTEIRRKSREQEAYMQSLLNEPNSDAWAQMAPLLDAALAGLGDKDRNAIVLRFFNGKKLSEIGAAMGMSEEAAKKRVNRAVEKLRRFFTGRGVVLPAAVMTTAISAFSVQAAPAGMVVSATGATASSSTLLFIKATLDKMLWAKLKTSIAGGMAVLLAAGLVIGVAGKVRSASLIEDVFRNMDAQSLKKVPAALVLRPTRYPGPADKSAWFEADFVARNTGLSGLFPIAYDYPWWNRVVLPADAPQGRYDLLVRWRDDTPETLRREIQRQLGLVAHREPRMTEVLVLEKDPAQAARLKISAGGQSTVNSPEWQPSGVRKLGMKNQPVFLLTQILENHLGAPVFDRTGLSGNYDLTLQWPAQNSSNLEVPAIQQAVADQLGLRLVSKQETAELLVVEKTGK
jgi:RNA polymerase sigma factor (sigma-70 family)